MKTHRSKIDIWLIVLLIIVFSYPIYQATYHQNWVQFCLFSMVAVLVFYSFSTLKYIIQDEFLVIKINFYTFNKIKISEIKSIENSNNLISSPALSIDRLSIKFGKFDEVLVSPKNKEAFTNDLSNVNTEIIINI